MPAKSKINWGGKPKPKAPPPKTTLHAAKKLPAIRTREQIVTDVRALLSDVNTAIGGMQFVSWGWLQDPRLRQLNTIADELQVEFSKMHVAEYEAKRAAGDTAAEYPYGRTEMMRLVMTEPGAEPTYAFPARFLVWVEDTPVLIVWGGFLDRHGFDIRGIDPRKPSLSNTGYRSGTVPPIHGSRSLRQMMTDAVEQSIKVKGGFVAIDAKSAASVCRFVGENTDLIAQLLGAPRGMTIPIPPGFSMQRPLL